MSGLAVRRTLRPTPRPAVLLLLPLTTLFARTLVLAISGPLLSSASAFAMSASAILPFRCALRPLSARKVSTMRNVGGVWSSYFAPNHWIVSSSVWTRSYPAPRNVATSSTFSPLATRGTKRDRETADATR